MAKGVIVKSLESRRTEIKQSVERFWALFMRHYGGEAIEGWGTTVGSAKVYLGVRGFINQKVNNTVQKSKRRLFGNQISISEVTSHC